MVTKDPGLAVSRTVKSDADVTVVIVPVHGGDRVRVRCVGNALIRGLRIEFAPSIDPNIRDGAN